MQPAQPAAVPTFTVIISYIPIHILLAVLSIRPLRGFPSKFAFDLRWRARHHPGVLHLAQCLTNALRNIGRHPTIPEGKTFEEIADALDVRAHNIYTYFSRANADYWKKRRAEALAEREKQATETAKKDG